MDSKIAAALLNAVTTAALDAALLGKADAGALASLLSTVDGLPLEVDTNLANALLGLATEAFVAAQLASRDASITALQASKADATLLASYATNAALSASETALQSALDAILAELAALQLSGSGVVNAPAWAGFTTWELVQGSVVRNLRFVAPLSAALANGDDTLSITADCDSTAGTDAAITAALLAYYTSSQVDSVGRLPHRNGAGRGDGRRHHGRAAGLLHLLTSRRAVEKLPHGERAGHADAGGHRGRAAGLPDGPGPGCVHHRPNRLGAGGVSLSRRPGHGDGLEHRRRAAQLLHHRTSRRPPRRQARSHGGGLGAANSRALSGRRRGRRGGGCHRRADPGPLSNWTVRPSSGCSVVLATHTAGVSVDGYTLTLAANPWNIMRTYNLTPGRELLFACRYRLGTASNFVVRMSEADNVYDPLYGSFVGNQGAWSTAKMYFTVPPNGVAKLPGAGPAQPDGWNGGRLRPPDPGRNPGDRQLFLQAVHTCTPWKNSIFVAQNRANVPLGFGALGKPNGLGGPVSNFNGAGMGEPCKTVQNRAKAMTLGCTFMYGLQ